MPFLSEARYLAIAVLPSMLACLVACSSGGASSDASDASDAATSTDASASDASTDASVRDAGPPPIVTLEFVDGAYSLYASMAGGPPHVVQLDTGSLGLFVPRAIVGSSAVVSKTDTCSITYVSSGRTLSGHKATGTVALLGSKPGGDATPAPITAPMPFCAVDDVSFDGGVMGVGFGRGTVTDTTKNVVLQLSGVVAGTTRAAFVLSTRPTPHLQLGISASAETGFRTIPLTPDPAGTGDFLASSLRGCVSVPSKPSFTEECGPMLVDTGVGETILWGPTDPTLGGSVPAGQMDVTKGTAVMIRAESDASILDYAFTVGSGADSPTAVTVRTASAFSINTGRALLVDYDYLFDADAAVVGFRRGGP